MTRISRRTFMHGAAAGALAASGRLDTLLAADEVLLAADEVLKVGIIHQGAISDTGWEYFQAQAAKALREAYPDKVKTTVIENILQNQDAERLFRQLASQGHKLIFGTTFSQYASLRKLAPTIKSAHFECCAGIETTDNLGVFEARHYEGSYITGIAAGHMTKSNILGWVGAYPVPQVTYSLNAFLLGSRTVNPNTVVKVVWTNAWVDSAKEKDAVAALVAQGADVISGSPNTPVQGLAAEEKGVWAIGNTGDFSAYVKKGQLTSFELDWSPAYLEAAKAVFDGTWKPVARWRGLGESGFVKMTTNNPALPESVVAEMKAAEAAIVAKTLLPFAGPLKDQNGNLKVAAGASIPDEELRGMNWLVEGVQGQLSAG